jgi:hypothetical protein
LESQSLKIGAKQKCRQFQWHAPPYARKLGGMTMVVVGLLAEAAKKSATNITNEPIGQTTQRQHAGFHRIYAKVGVGFLLLERGGEARADLLHRADRARMGAADGLSRLCSMLVFARVVAPLIITIPSYRPSIECKII